MPLQLYLRLEILLQLNFWDRLRGARIAAGFRTGAVSKFDLQCNDG